MCHNFGILDNLDEVPSEASVRLVKQDTIFKNYEHNWSQNLKKTYLKYWRQKCEHNWCQIEKALVTETFVKF